MTALHTESLKSNSKKDIYVSHVFSLARLGIKLPPQQDGKMGFLHVDHPARSRLWPSLRETSSALIQKQAMTVRFNPGILQPFCLPVFFPQTKLCQPGNLGTGGDLSLEEHPASGGAAREVRGRTW